MSVQRDSLFEDDQATNKKEQDEFAQSCSPLEELLDSLKGIEGFPIGKDEDILELSDPPYYTACPNPYINDFIEKYGMPYDKATDSYERTPFVGDVSEGKNDSVYNAHSYHTKVPYKAIREYIKHYTDCGDIVFDGFCGSGMTGVASQLLERRAILTDISTAASFISYNYNSPINMAEFTNVANRVITELEKECGWMYETKHFDGSTKGKINYVIWSDVLICPYCNNEYVFSQVALNKVTGAVKDRYECPDCKSLISKRECKGAEVTNFDPFLNINVTQRKYLPVLINYTVNKKRFDKTPDNYDLEIIKKISLEAIPYWVPTERMPAGDESRRNDKIGLTHSHHFYTRRNLWVLACLFNKITSQKNPLLLFGFLNTSWHGTLMRRFNARGGDRPLSGTLYVPSIPTEGNLIDIYSHKIKQLFKFAAVISTLKRSCVITTQSTTDLPIKADSVDYIFTDPPFGENLMYSELNFLWESWLKVYTNNNSEAIINNSQQKGLLDYKDLMTSCFSEMFRILKPNRWITVVFHNSKASVWNAIQEAMTKAGFIIAQVTVLDKKQGSFKQVTSAGAVKNDLVINAYKPKKLFQENFLKKAGDGLEKDFIAEHLQHLPIEPNLERTEQMLYSKVLAHYVQHGFEIKLNARQFFSVLKNNFKYIDGYWFNDDQVLKYEEWKKKQGLSGIKEIKTGQQIMFINDEKSALIWLYNFLDCPKTYGDIFISYNKAAVTSDDNIPELRELLDNNFIFENKCYRRPLTEKEKETVEEQRERELARAFERLLFEAGSSGKKLKGVRKEAISFGFTRAYQEKRFEDILSVAKKLDKKVLEENSELNDFVEIAKLKLGEAD